MSKKPRRVEQCTTHHSGCACREWQFEQMRMALRIIRTWASFDRNSGQVRLSSLDHIVAKCDEALGDKK